MEKIIPVKVKDLVKEKRRLIAVDCDTTVEDAILLLSKEKLISLPVYGKPGHWLGSGGMELVANDKQYIGKIL
jgi:predicted transcriptional regulator